MVLELRVFIILVSVAVFTNVIRMLVRHQLNESHSIFWLFIATTILIFGIFPDIANKTARMLGIDYQPALLFLGSSILLLMITFRQSVQLSKSEAKLCETTITLSILKEEQRCLSAKLDGLIVLDSCRKFEESRTVYEDTGCRQQLRDSEPDSELVKTGKA